MRLATERSLEAAVIRTILYADVFSYAPTIKEIFTWLIAPLDLQQSPPTYNLINKIIKSYPFLITKKDRVGLSPTNINTSQTAFSHLPAKLSSARRAAKILSIIPTIKLIAVSGSVAAASPKPDDDIDFFVITRKHTLWLTRLLTIILTEIFSIRRRPQDTDYNNKICLNLFLDTANLALPTSRRDLYTARELLQIIPLLNRDQTYQRLLTQNTWALDYFPLFSQSQIAWLSSNLEFSPESKSSKPSFLETLARRLQQKYMSHRQTREVATNHSAYFHPFDYRQYVVDSYQAKLTLYNKLYCEKNAPHRPRPARLGRRKIHPQRPQFNSFPR